MMPKQASLSFLRTNTRTHAREGLRPTQQECQSYPQLCPFWPTSSPRFPLLASMAAHRPWPLPVAPSLVHAEFSYLMRLQVWPSLEVSSIWDEWLLNTLSFQKLKKKETKENHLPMLEWCSVFPPWLAGNVGLICLKITRLDGLPGSGSRQPRLPLCASACVYRKYFKKWVENGIKI